MEKELKIRQAKSLDDIKISLEICSKNTNCDKCKYRSYDYCFRELCKDILIYINANKIQDIYSKKSV